MLSGCTLYDKKRNSGLVAEYKGRTLTYAEIDLLTAGMSPEDSLRVAEQYIRQWAIDLLTYDKAKDKPNKSIERLVEDYRHSLYIHEYEQRLIAQRMPQEVEDTIVNLFYKEHRHQLILRETILKGLLLVIPIDAPNMEQLRKKIHDFPHSFFRLRAPL